jgi:hypothetical protein
MGLLGIAPRQLSSRGFESPPGLAVLRMMSGVPQGSGQSVPGHDIVQVAAVAVTDSAPQDREDLQSGGGAARAAVSGEEEAMRCQVADVWKAQCLVEEATCDALG